MHKFFGILFIFVTACRPASFNSQVVPVFHKYKELNAQFIESIKSNDTAQDEKREKAETYMYKEYTEALNVLEKRYCSEPDEKVLDEFISVLIATENSAYELPSFVLGTMYTCQPDLVIDNIHALGPIEKQYIINALDWGFQNVTYEKKVKNYAELVNKLNKLKVKATIRED